MKNIFSFFLLLLLGITACKKEVAISPSFLLKGEIDHPVANQLPIIIQTDTASFFFDTLQIKENRFELTMPADSLIKIQLLNGNKEYAVYMAGGDTLEVAIRQDSLQVKGRTTPFATWSINNYIQNPTDSLHRLPAIIRNQIEEYLSVSKKAPLDGVIPYIVFKDAEGNNISTIESNGHYQLITFWASWDTVSVKQIKELDKIKKSLNNKAIDFISISVEANDSIWKKTVKELKIPGRQVRLKDGFADPLGRKLGLYTLPQNILVNNESKIVRKNLFGEALIEYLKSEIILNKEEAEKKYGNGRRNLRKEKISEKIRDNMKK